MSGPSSQEPSPQTRKKVDESWKDSVRKEKSEAQEAPSSEPPLPEPDFSFFLSTLGMQAMMALEGGPGDGAKDAVRKPDLKQARYIIDILAMLSEKTKGNLTPAEEKLSSDLLYELRVKFVQKDKELSGI